MLIQCITFVKIHCITCITLNYCQGVHGQGKSQGKTNFFKVRELSENFEIGQGNLEMKQKVREF